MTEERFVGSHARQQRRSHAADGRDPDFEATARTNRWKFFRYQEDLLDHFMEGLRKAGLNIPDEPAAAE